MAASDVKPAFSKKEEGNWLSDFMRALGVYDSTNGRWKIELVNFQKFEEVLTQKVLNAFCRCFIQSDRLLRATSCSDASEKLNGKDSVVFGRDLIAMVWFTIGTLRELAKALKDLRSALEKRGLLDSGSAPWAILSELEERWDRDKFFIKMRNGGAFHIDKKIIEDGLTEMLKDSGVVLLAEGDGRKNFRSQMPVGTLVLHAGLWGSSLDEYGEFISIVGKDSDRASLAIQKAFIQACEKAGIPVQESIGP